MADLRFDGRVVVVTGAGAGLGRTYALLFASRGAKLVVNDLGGGRHGDGNSTKAADTVVEEIKRNGGIAVADYNSVLDGEKIIKTALDNFGKVDVVINNAGILRDKSFPRISEADWDLIYNVHVKGSFKTTQAAFHLMKKQGYGRIIMTSSGAGLYGNFGQANYSAAKMAVVGLSNTIAIEGGKYNIHCNVIVPTAASRLTEDILPPDLFDELKPELIAPVVAYLCHESCPENGVIIETAAGWAGKVHLIRSPGALMRSRVDEGVKVESVRDRWEQITDMKRGNHLDTIQEATASLITHLEHLKTAGATCETDVYEFNDKDLILYALGIGASVSKPEELKFLYENHEEFGALPTFFVLPALQYIFIHGESETAVPGRSINLSQILHGEQYLEVFKALPCEGTIRSTGKIVEVLDKGSGAALVYDVETVDEQGDLLCRNQTVVFAVGAGNFGGARNGTKIIACETKPSRRADLSVSHVTSIDQAALYRLSGDRNPLHIDPNMAMVGGFAQPILHGLCSFGISVRLILRSYADNDPNLFKAVKVRFVKPVLPGQTLKVDMWREKNRIYFETSVVETGTVVIAGAYVDLNRVVMQHKANKLSAAMKLESDAIFEYIVDKMKANPEKAKSVNGVFLYKITKDGKEVKQWTMDLKKAEVYEGTPKNDKPNTTLTVSDEDFVQMALGKLNPQAAFMRGKLKISGNVMLAQKLGPLLKAEANL